MHYLVCDRCGHPNPAQSPALIFCGGCGHKLDRCFSAWQQQHPEQTLSEFWRSECTTDPQPPAALARRGANPSVVVLAIAAALVVLGAVAWSLLGRGAERITGLSPGELRFVSADTSRWQPFGGDEGRFGVYLPLGEPQRSVTGFSSFIGPIDLVSYSLELDPQHHSNMAYIVAFAEYPGSFMAQFTERDHNLDLMLDDAVQSLVRGAKAPLIAAYHHLHDGHAGRAVMVELGGGAAILTARIYMVGSTMYFLQVVTPIEQHPNPAADFFLGSFEPKSP